MLNKNIKNTAIKAVTIAAKKLIKVYNSFERRTVKMKSAHEILTSADLLSEKIIISEIKRKFSKHSILSEEAGLLDKEKDYLWIIDPIDGTTNFSMHNPLWSMSLGLAYKGEIIFGLIYAPMLKEMYWAEKGCGAYCNNKKIQVSSINSGKVINTFCHGSNEKDIKRAIKYFQKQKLANFDCRQLGSAALELAYVASGRIESIVIPGVRSWDVAAGILLVSEAGGTVTNFKNKPWTLKDCDLIATNGLVQEQIINVLNS
ncbi:MAG: inositol monophosphatase [Planctomycetes bacterium]|jgi:myo-inositol-1(or 4)-monophosphatase|nr:inositol monophosphatase [Planctomycetota bacterium]